MNTFNMMIEILKQLNQGKTLDVIVGGMTAKVAMTEDHELVLVWQVSVVSFGKPKKGPEYQEIHTDLSLGGLYALVEENNIIPIPEVRKVPR